MKWDLYAHKVKDTFLHVGIKMFVEIHFLDYPIVPVKVIEDKDGDYYGWLDNTTDHPTMIWPDEVRFNMCFPYGPEEEEKAGHGKILKLKIIEKEKE